MQKPPSNSLDFEALGTHWSIKFENIKLTSQHRGHLLQLVTDFEDTYSRFKPYSQISVLNQTSALDKPSGELRDMLVFSLTMYKASDGAFDISIGGELEKNGYGLANGTSRSDNLPEDLIITKDKITLGNEIHLDFGGFGKGWLVDKINQFLSARSLDYYVINGGGDIFVRSSSPEEIYIADPADGRQFYGTTYLKNKALAASSNQTRQWKKGDNLHSHIPNTSDDELLSIHVIADSTAKADALATAMMVVDRPSRMKLAKQFGAEFLEIRKNSKSFRTNQFHWQPNV